MISIALVAIYVGYLASRRGGVENNLAETRRRGGERGIGYLECWDREALYSHWKDGEGGLEKKVCNSVISGVLFSSFGFSSFVLSRSLCYIFSR